MSGPRQKFTQEDDNYLFKYIAKYNPEKPGRMGNVLYKRLAENAEGQWPWSKRHSWQGWRERYKDNQHWFDAAIRKYQRKKGISGGNKIPWHSQNKKVQTRSSDSDGTGPKADANEPSSSKDPVASPAQRSSQNNPGASSQLNGDEQGDVSEETAVNPRLAASQGHKHIARKTARKTVVVPDEEEVGETESDGVTFEEEPTNEMKRTADIPTVPSQAKRRRIDEMDKNAPPVDATSGSNDTGTSGIPSSQKPNSMSRSLELLSAFGQNGDVLVNKKTLEILLQALESRPEEKRQIIDFAKSRLSEGSPSKIENEEMEDGEPLYPHLEEDDYNPTGDAPADDTIPGSWDYPQESFASAAANEAQDMDEASNVGSRPAEHSRQVEVGDNQGSSLPYDHSPPQAQHRVSKKQPEDDFFKTPPPSPEKMSNVLPTSFPHDAQVAPAREQNGPDSRAQLALRYPPHNPLRRAPVRMHMYGWRRRQAPGVDTDSDTDVIPDDRESTHVVSNSQARREPWPPLRKKKSTEDISPARSARPAPRPSISPARKPALVAPDEGALDLSPRQPEVAPKPSQAKTVPSVPANRMRHGTSSSLARNGREAAEMKQTAPPMPQPLPQPQPVLETGPSRRHDSILQKAPVEIADESKNFDAWRSETHVSEDQDEHVLSTSVSDPFLTIDHANRLRGKEKGKSKEEPMKAGERETGYADSRRIRRTTFAGFPTLNPPEIDLRKKTLRSSIANNSVVLSRRLSFPSSNFSARDKEQDGDHVPRRNHRTSIAATIDLSQEFPSSDMEIPPADHAFIMRAGVQVLIQSIAQNHAVSEEFVRGIYEELLDLQATDRVISKMRRAAERTVEEELQREKQKKQNIRTSSTPTSPGLAEHLQPIVGSNIQASPERGAADVSTLSSTRARSASDRRQSKLFTTPTAGAESTPILQDSAADRQPVASTSVQSSPDRREANVSVVSASDVRTSSGRRRSELYITPADDDPTYVRLRSQYVPPSASRAARFVRHRARRSSGLASSPLNGYDEKMQVDEDNESEKEEEEVTLALTPAREFEDTRSSSSSSHATFMRPGLRHAANAATARRASQKAQALISQAWTIEEDSILLGEDEDAIEAIIKRKGNLAVRRRIIELSEADQMS